MNYKTDGNFHTDFIEMLAKRMRPTVYVELGVGVEATTIRRVAPYCLQAVGVDTCNVWKRPGDTLHFYQETTAEFIANELKLLQPIELALIDADHNCLRVQDDLSGLLPFMADNGIILLHDTYPEGERYEDKQLCDNAWLAAVWARCKAAELNIEVATLPFPPGLTIVRKLPPRHLHWKGEI